MRKRKDANEDLTQHEIFERSLVLFVKRVALGQKVTAAEVEALPAVARVLVEFWNGE